MKSDNSGLPINSSVKGRWKKWIKKVPRQAKGVGTFFFGMVLKQEINQQAVFQISTCILHWSAMVEQKKGFVLLDLQEFRS